MKWTWNERLVHFTHLDSSVMETLERLAQLLVTRCLLELGELGRRYYSSLSAVMSRCSGGNEMATCCKEDYHKLLSTSYISGLCVCHACSSHKCELHGLIFIFYAVCLAYLSTKMLPAKLCVCFRSQDEDTCCEVFIPDLFLGRLNTWMLTGILSYRFNSVSATFCSLLMLPLCSL